MRVAAILLAAGSSRRFGGQKLLAPWRGRPLYEHALEALLASPAVTEIIVVVQPGFAVPPARQRCRFIENPEHAEGMGASLRAGVRAAPADAEAYLVALADMPRITPELVAALVAGHAAAGRPIMVPVHGGRRGHPVVMGRELREALLAVTGDVGAREIIRAHPGWVAELETADEAVVFDVDLPADLVVGEDAVARPERAHGRPGSRERSRNGGRESVLIKGAGEQASATAHRLFRCGYRVAMTDLERPTAIRRTVAFCTAIYEGEIEVEGVRGVRATAEEVVAGAADGWPHIPVCVDPASRLVALWRPDVVVDARILKTNLDNRRDDAPLVIGLGPGLVAGRDVHFVVETMRGHDLGRIIANGPSSSDTGEPGEIGGYTHERVVRAPVDGVFTSSRRIGERVASGEVLGSVAGVEMKAQIAGVLRGLLWPGLPVTEGFKVADVDPRGDASMCTTLSDKARIISGSVLEIVVAHAGQQAPRDA